MLFLARAENKNKKMPKKYDCKESHIKTLQIRWNYSDIKKYSESIIKWNEDTQGIRNQKGYENIKKYTE